MAVAAPRACASAVKSAPVRAASTARRQASRPPARNSWATASSPWPDGACAGSSPARFGAGACHSPRTQPSVAGTSEVPSAVSAAPTSTSGLTPSERTRKNFTIAADSPSSTMTELLDCSPDRTLTMPWAVGRRWSDRVRWPVAEPVLGPDFGPDQLQPGGHKGRIMHGVVDPGHAGLGRPAHQRPLRSGERTCRGNSAEPGPRRSGVRRRPSGRKQPAGRPPAAPARRDPQGSGCLPAPAKNRLTSRGTSAGAEAIRAGRHSAWAVRVGSFMSVLDGQDGQCLRVRGGRIGRRRADPQPEEVMASQGQRQ